RSYRNSVCSKTLDRKAVLSTKPLRYSNSPRVGPRRGTRELEDHSSESVASTFSYEPPELLLWPYTNSTWDLYAVGFHRKITGYFFVCLRRDARAICSAHHAWQKLSTHDRVLDLGGSVYYNGVAAGRTRSRGVSGDSDIAVLGEADWREMRRWYPRTNNR